MPHNPDISKNYYRHRIRSPSIFKPDSYITLDIGESGKHKLIRARLKSTGNWKTQSVLVERKYAKQLRSETAKIVERAKKDYH